MSNISEKNAIKSFHYYHLEESGFIFLGKLDELCKCGKKHPDAIFRDSKNNIILVEVTELEEKNPKAKQMVNKSELESLIDSEYNTINGSFLFSFFLDSNHKKFNKNQVSSMLKKFKEKIIQLKKNQTLEMDYNLSVLKITESEEFKSYLWIQRRDLKRVSSYGTLSDQVKSILEKAILKDLNETISKFQDCSNCLKKLNIEGIIIKRILLLYGFYFGLNYQFDRKLIKEILIKDGIKNSVIDEVYLSDSWAEDGNNIPILGDFLKNDSSVVFELIYKKSLEPLPQSAS